ncbi:MAG: hypothetical protein FWB88_01320 [Defluviitaleaceae bacterium]|nr:hypothetical protein [Defluviitaleaceae bacterium]MCL2240843.1 hypothetical protein [Defluviitaleaceae bacterium]
MVFSIAGFNNEAKKGKDIAHKYCRLWQTEITKLGANMVVDLTKKNISQAAYNLKKADLNKQTEDLNKCIKLVNSLK